MPTGQDEVLQGAVALLSSFIEPNEDLLAAYLTSIGRIQEFDPEDWRRSLTWALRPFPEDYELVFVGPAAEKARIGYDEIWKSGELLIEPRATHNSIRVTVSKAAEIAVDPAAIEQFPGGYRDVIEHLVPDRFWCAWEFFEQGMPYGLQYNGLVLIEERFAYFPKPFHVITG